MCKAGYAQPRQSLAELAGRTKPPRIRYVPSPSTGNNQTSQGQGAYSTASAYGGGSSGGGGGGCGGGGCGGG